MKIDEILVKFSQVFDLSLLSNLKYLIKGAQKAIFLNFVSLTEDVFQTIFESSTIGEEIHFGDHGQVTLPESFEITQDEDCKTSKIVLPYIHHSEDGEYLTLNKFEKLVAALSGTPLKGSLKTIQMESPTPETLEELERMFEENGFVVTIEDSGPVYS